MSFPLPSAASFEFESAALSERLARINKLTDQLFEMQSTSQEGRALAEKIQREIQAAIARAIAAR